MGVATTIESSIDLFLNGFVSDKSQALCGILLPIAVTGVTIYMLLVGYSIMRGEANDSLNTFMKKALKISIIGAIALGGGLYQSYVVSAITGIQGIFTAAFGNAQTIGVMIDNMCSPFDSLSTSLFQKATATTIPSCIFLFAGAVVVVSQVVICISMLTMYILAKVALALLLAIGPFFILCWIFPVSKRYSELWLGQALNYVFINVLIAALISMPSNLMKQFAQTVTNNQNTENIISATVSLLIMSFTLSISVVNIRHIAGGIVGGATLIGGEKFPEFFKKDKRNGNGKNNNKNSTDSTQNTNSATPTSTTNPTGNSFSKTPDNKVPIHRVVTQENLQNN